MGKLIAAFEKAPNDKNARKLVLYVNSHPMCAILMTAEDAAIYKTAYDMYWHHTNAYGC